MARSTVFAALLRFTACAHEPNPAPSSRRLGATTHYRVTIFDKLNGTQVPAHLR